ELLPDLGLLLLEELSVGLAVLYVEGACARDENFHEGVRDVHGHARLRGLRRNLHDAGDAHGAEPEARGPELVEGPALGTLHHDLLAAQATEPVLHHARIVDGVGILYEIL